MGSGPSTPKSSSETRNLSQLNSTQSSVKLDLDEQIRRTEYGFYLKSAGVEYEGIKDKQQLLQKIKEAKTTNGNYAYIYDSLIREINDDFKGRVFSGSCENGYLKFAEYIATGAGRSNNTVKGGCECQDSVFLGGNDLTSLAIYKDSLNFDTKKKFVDSTIDFFSKILNKPNLNTNGFSHNEKVDNIISAIFDAIPGPHNRKQFNESPEAQRKLLEKIAEKINETWPKLINVNMDANDLFETIIEFLGSLQNGVMSEYIKFYDSIRNALNNLKAVSELTRTISDGLGASEPLKDMPDAHTQKLVSDQLAVLGELSEMSNLYISMLENLLNLKPESVDVNLKKIIDSYSELKPGRGADGVKSQFNQKLEHLLGKMVGTAYYTQYVNNILTKFGLKIEDIKKAVDKSKLIHDRLNEIILKTNNKDFDELRKLMKYSEFLDTLVQTNPTYFGKGELINDLPSDERRTLDKRIEIRGQVKETLEKMFDEELRKLIVVLTAQFSALMNTLGRTIEISFELEQAVEAVERLSTYLEINKKRFATVLVSESYGLNTVARESADTFVNTLMAMRDIFATISVSDAGTKTKITEFIDTLNKIVVLCHGFADRLTNFKQNIATVSGSAENEGCEYIYSDENRVGAGEPLEPEEIRTGAAEAMRKYTPIIYDLQETIMRFKMVFNSARIKQNLEKSKTELDAYSAKYGDLRSKSVASRIQKIRKWHEDRKAELDRVPESVMDKATVTKIHEFLFFQRDTKISFWETVEAIDEYLRLFTDGIVKNPQEVRDIKNMLDGVELIYDWYSASSGAAVHKLFDEFPAYREGDGLDVGDKHTASGSVPGHFTVDASSVYRDIDDDIHYMEAVREENENYIRDPTDVVKHLPGNPYLVRDLGADFKGREYIQNTLEGMVALKNILAAFLKIGESFGGQELYKKVFMKPSKIYENLCNYIEASAISMGSDNSTVLYVQGQVEGNEDKDGVDSLRSYLRKSNPELAAKIQGRFSMNPMERESLSREVAGLQQLRIIDINEAELLRHKYDEFMKYVLIHRFLKKLDRVSNPHTVLIRYPTAKIDQTTDSFFTKLATFPATDAQFTRKVLESKADANMLLIANNLVDTKNTKTEKAHALYTGWDRATMTASQVTFIRSIAATKDGLPLSGTYTAQLQRGQQNYTYNAAEDNNGIAGLAAGQRDPDVHGAAGANDSLALPYSLLATRAPIPGGYTTSVYNRLKDPSTRLHKMMERLENAGMYDYEPMPMVYKYEQVNNICETEPWYFFLEAEIEANRGVFSKVINKRLFLERAKTTVATAALGAAIILAVGNANAPATPALETSADTICSHADGITSTAADQLTVRNEIVAIWGSLLNGITHLTVKKYYIPRLGYLNLEAISKVSHGGHLLSKLVNRKKIENAAKAVASNSDFLTALGAINVNVTNADIVYIENLLENLLLHAVLDNKSVSGLMASVLTSWAALAPTFYTLNGIEYTRATPSNIDLTTFFTAANANNNTLIQLLARELGIEVADMSDWLKFQKSLIGNTGLGPNNSVFKYMNRFCNLVGNGVLFSVPDLVSSPTILTEFEGNVGDGVTDCLGPNFHTSIATTIAPVNAPNKKYRAFGLPDVNTLERLTPLEVAELFLNFKEDIETYERTIKPENTVYFGSGPNNITDTRYARTYYLNGAGALSDLKETRQSSTITDDQTIRAIIASGRSTVNRERITYANRAWKDFLRGIIHVSKDKSNAQITAGYDNLYTINRDGANAGIGGNALANAELAASVGNNLTSAGSSYANWQTVENTKLGNTKKTAAALLPFFFGVTDCRPLRPGRDNGAGIYGQGDALSIVLDRAGNLGLTDLRPTSFVNMLRALPKALNKTYKHKPYIVANGARWDAAVAVIAPGQPGAGSLTFDHLNPDTVSSNKLKHIVEYVSEAVKNIQRATLIHILTALKDADINIFDPNFDPARRLTGMANQAQFNLELPKAQKDITKRMEEIITEIKGNNFKSVNQLLLAAGYTYAPVTWSWNAGGGNVDRTPGAAANLDTLFTNDVVAKIINEVKSASDSDVKKVIDIITNPTGVAVGDLPAAKSYNLRKLTFGVAAGAITAGCIDVNGVVNTTIIRAVATTGTNAAPAGNENVAPPTLHFENLRVTLAREPIYSCVDSSKDPYAEGSADDLIKIIDEYATEIVNKLPRYVDIIPRTTAAVLLPISPIFTVVVQNTPQVRLGVTMGYEQERSADEIAKLENRKKYGIYMRSVIKGLQGVNIGTEGQEFEREDRFFVHLMKAIAAKVFTVIGTYDLLERPGEVLPSASTRLILGGSEDSIFSGGYDVPMIDPEALDLYVRIPLLVQFYKKLFSPDRGNAGDYASVDTHKIGLVADSDGPYGQLLFMMFHKISVSDISTLSDVEIGEIIKQINVIYQETKKANGSNFVKLAIDGLVNEVNRRYGVVRADSVDKYNKQFVTESATLDTTIERNSRNYAILPDESADFSSSGIPPSRTLSGLASMGVAKQEMENHDIFRAHEYLFYKFRSLLDKQFLESNTEIKDLGVDKVMRGKGKPTSFKSSIYATKKKLLKSQDPDEKFRIVAGLLRGSITHSRYDRVKIATYHETVVAGTNALAAVTALLNQWKARVLMLDIDMLAKELHNAFKNFPNTKPTITGGVPATDNDNGVLANAGGLRSVLVKIVASKFYRGNFDGIKLTSSQAELATYILSDGAGTHNSANKGPEIISEAFYKGLFRSSGTAPQIDSTTSVEGIKEIILDNFDISGLFSELYSLLSGVSNDTMDLVKTTVSDGHVYINFAGLRGAVQTLYEETRYFYEMLRPFIDPEILNKIAEKTRIGSIYNVREQLIDKLLIGRSSIEAGTSLNIYPKLEELAKSLDSTFISLKGKNASSIVSRIAGVRQSVIDQPAVCVSPDTLFGRLFFLNTGTSVSAPARALLYNPSLYTWNVNELGPSRSIMMVFNQLIAKYLNAFMDPSSEKIYSATIDRVVYGTANSIISNPDLAYPDGALSGANSIRVTVAGSTTPIIVTKDTRYDYIVSQKAFKDISVEFMPSRKSDAFFKTRAPPIPSAAIYMSLATIINNIVKSKHSLTGADIYKITNIADVPSFLRDRFKSHMPIFKNLFKEVIAQCELLRNIIKNFGIVTTNLDVSNVAIDRNSGNYFKQLMPKGANMDSKSYELLGTIMDIAGNFVQCIDQVLSEVADDPKYMEISPNFINDYKSANKGKEPIMPLSFALRFLIENRTVESKPFLGLTLYGTAADKYMYGMRGLLGRLTDKFSLANAPWMKSLLDEFNSSIALSRAGFDKNRSEAFVANFAAITRYLYTLVGIRANLTYTNADGLGVEMTNIELEKETGRGMYNGSFLRSRLFNDNQTLNNNSGTLISKGTANNRTVVFSLAPNNTFDSMISILTSTDQDVALNDLVKRITKDKSVHVPNPEIINIMDLNIVPINVHALMRDIPLVNIYNYSYTFDRLLVELMYNVNNDFGNLLIHQLNQDNSGSFGMRGMEKRAGFTEVGFTEDDIVGRVTNTVRSSKELFLALLIDPYRKIITDDEYDLVKRLFIGDTNLELSRPKFLSDQLWNKSMFRSLEDTDYQESGPRHNRDSTHNLEIGYLDEGKYSKNERDEVYDEDKLKVFKINTEYNTIVQLIGRLRFDTKFMRNLIFLVNIYRVMRLKMRKDLSDQRKVISRGHDVTAEENTEFVRNQVQTQNIPSRRRQN